MIFYSLRWRLQISLTLNSDIQGSFKKFSLLCRQAEMVFVIVWFLHHFTLKPVPSVNGVWIITFVSHLHVWVTKFKPSLLFFKLPVLTSNNVIWVNFSTILFDETQYVCQNIHGAHMLVCYEVINLFIKSQNFLLMVCDGLSMFFLHFVCKLPPNMRKQHIAAVSSEVFCLWLLA